MEEGFIELAKEDEETKKIIQERLLELKDMNVATRATATPKLIISVEYFKTGLNIAGETIYNLKVDKDILQEENIDLKEELEKYTNVNYEQLANNERERRLKKLKEDKKGQVILEELRKTVRMSRQLTAPK
jgi:hypothetical protein